MSQALRLGSEDYDGRIPKHLSSDTRAHLVSNGERRATIEAIEDSSSLSLMRNLSEAFDKTL